MTKNDFIILVDMDDTIENLRPAWIKKLNEKYGTNIDACNIEKWDLDEYFPKLTRDQIFSPIFEENFWETVTPKLDAIEYLTRLYNEGFNLYLVTASHYRTLTEKFEKALFPYFPFFTEDKIIICDNKQLINGHVLIDDAVHNLLGGKYHKILYNTNVSKDFNAEAFGIWRAHNWEEIYRIIQRLYKYELERQSMQEQETT